MSAASTVAELHALRKRVLELEEQLEAAQHDRDEAREGQREQLVERLHYERETARLQEQLGAAQQRVNWSVGREAELSEQLEAYEEALRKIVKLGGQGYALTASDVAREALAASIPSSEGATAVDRPGTAPLIASVEGSGGQVPGTVAPSEVSSQHSELVTTVRETLLHSQHSAEMVEGSPSFFDPALEALSSLEEQLEKARDGWITADAECDRLIERERGLLEQLEALRAGLREALDIIVWMSGSDDFAPNGKASEGWTKARDQLDRLFLLAGSNPASSPENVTSLPVCPECAEGRHIYCLDDGSSTWTDKCRCTCREEQSPAYRPEDDPLSPRGQFDDVIVADASPAKAPLIRGGTIKCEECGALIGWEGEPPKDCLRCGHGGLTEAAEQPNGSGDARSYPASSPAKERQ